MNSKERWNKVMQSLKKKPIKLMDEESWKIGGSFFWRQLILLSPAYAFLFWGEFNPIPMRQITGATLIVLLVVLVPYMFFGLGMAEGWRTSKSSFPPGSAVNGALKLGFSLWWRILVTWIRLILVLIILGVIAAFMKLDEEIVTVLGIVVWFVLSIPVMGVAVRLWLRTVQVKADAESPVPAARR